MSDKIAFDALWDESPIDVTPEVNFIWSIANKLRGSYMPDKYGDVIIPMTILRRLECALEPHKEAVLAKFAENPNYPPKAMYRVSGYQFYNTSPYTLKELCNEPDNIKSNFKVYIQGFSAEVQEIFNGLEMFSHIDKMDKDGCLFSVVQAFADLDLDPKTYDSIKMGYIFEHLIGKFYQNVDAGQFYTGRDIIKCLVAVLISEGCDDIFDDGKVVTVCDQACGTGGMLSTAYSFIKHYNPSADVRLFGQEFMPQSYAVGLAEMMIKGQNVENFRNADTFKEDCFPNIKMRFVLENPPFGTPWAGKDAKAGQEDAVRNEFKRGKKGRWGAGLPSGGDSQLIFMQSAIDKMDDKVGRAAIIENNSPLFTGGTASGESQIRRWILDQDLLEAVIALPKDLFYNTGIATYVWILSKNKRSERRGYVQLIDATSIYHKLRKAAGNKKNELLPEDRSKIVKLYTAFEKNEYCKIFKKEEFLYREYTVMQPLQRSYAITEERVEQMLADGTLNSVYDPAKVDELEEQGAQISVKDKMKLDKLYEQKPVYAVQTLSRLNRVCPPFDKKVVVMDFVNHAEEMEEAFAPFYTTTVLSNTATIAQLRELENKIDGYNVLDDRDVDTVAGIVYNPKGKRTTAKEDRLVYQCIQRAVNVLKNQFNEDHQRAFTKNCRGFVRLYEFLSMASSFGDPELHKKYVFVNLLLTYLVVGNSGGISLKDKIQATNFVQESQGDKGNKQRHASAPNVKLSGADVGLTVDEVKHLSEIIDEVNSRAGKGYDSSAMTKVMLQIKDLLLHSDKLKTAAKNNTEQDFEFSFYDNTDDALIEGLSQNQDFFSLLLSNDDIKHRVLGVFLHEVYKELREQQ